MFTTSLFTVIKTWKQLRWASVGKCKETVVHPQNSVLFSNEK